MSRLGNTLYICNTDGDASVWYGDAGDAEEAIAGVLVAEGDYTDLSIEDVEGLPLSKLKSLAKRYLTDSAIIFKDKVVYGSKSGKCKVFGNEVRGSVYITTRRGIVEVYPFDAGEYDIMREVLSFERDRSGDPLTPETIEILDDGDGYEEEADRLDGDLAEQNRGGLVLVRSSSGYEEYYSNDVIDIDSYEF